MQSNKRRRMQLCVLEYQATDQGRIGIPKAEVFGVEYRMTQTD
jgi:hypothetical protein